MQGNQNQTNMTGQYHGNYGGYGSTDYGMYGPQIAQQLATTVSNNGSPRGSYVSETQTITTQTNYGNNGQNYMGGAGYGMTMGQNAQMAAEMARISGVNSVTGNTSIGSTTTYTGTAVGGMGVSTVEVVPPPPQPKSRSRIQYIPVEQKVIDYQTNQWIETVPRQKTVTQYEERRWTEQVPRQVTRTDHYAVEHVRQYVPEVIQTKQVQMIPQERIVQRTDFVPVQRQINLGLQGNTRINEGRVVGYGQSVNHEVIPMGVTQGQTTVIRGQASFPQVVGVTQGSSSYYGNTGFSNVGYGNTMYSNTGMNYGVGVGVTPAYEINQKTTTTTTTTGGYGTGY